MLLALTPTCQQDSGLISRQPPYYSRMTHYFTAYREEPAIYLMDSLVRAGRYFDIKTDAYAFQYDPQGRIVRSAIYDRINWGRTNSLLPYIHRLQQFSDRIRFSHFIRRIGRSTPLRLMRIATPYRLEKW